MVLGGQSKVLEGLEEDGCKLGGPGYASSALGGLDEVGDKLGEPEDAGGELGGLEGLELGSQSQVLRWMGLVGRWGRVLSRRGLAEGEEGRVGEHPLRRVEVGGRLQGEVVSPRCVLEMAWQ